MRHFNELTPAQAERLAWLMEELAEAQQMIGKILRHGFDSSHPHYENIPNRTNLEKELGHVEAAMSLLIERNDISMTNIVNFMAIKKNTMKYLHHQNDE